MVLFSVIGGIIGIGNPEHLGKMGGKTLGLYLISTVFAVSLGLLLVNVIKPGDNADLTNRIQYELWANASEIEIKDGQCYSCLDEHAELVAEVKQFMASEEIPEEVSKRLATQEKTVQTETIFETQSIPEEISSVPNDQNKYDACRTAIKKAGNIDKLYICQKYQ